MTGTYRRGLRCPTMQTVHHVGSSQIQKVFEMDLNGMTFAQLLPDLDLVEAAAHPEWFPAGTTDDEGHAYMSLHAWLIRHDDRLILVDTGAGNDKPRPQQLVLHGLATAFLDRLSDLGVQPEDIDVVLHTHIHSDHVGWDTKLADGKWVPTFPNAEVIVSDVEYAYGTALTAGDDESIRSIRAAAGLGEPVRLPVSGTFADSIQPLDGRVQVRRIAIDGSEVLPGIRFVSTRGHSIDHASIELRSGGEVALFSGDVFHHPVEVYHPDVTSVFCEFPEGALASRHAFLAKAADSGALVFTSHFPRSSVGHVVRKDGGYGWEFADD